MGGDMRDIKFRGHTGNSWVYGNLLAYKDGQIEIENTDPDDFAQWPVKPETVGEYTGMVDKNGTEIYEGDILQTRTIGLLRKVVFSCRDFHTGWKLESTAGRLTDIGKNDAAHLEIVGNFLENPELSK
jgi:uncharacterized phage protein (TIGR01671 family)